MGGVVSFGDFVSGKAGPRITEGQTYLREMS